ncbi:hypothetical protein Pyn_19167 [Prunus yedoensis var. nudiflora]|uniref:Uncharacterized protein n=1 Tax=Prunus yedoensis var. nudiflora TaxID=2094558 RepID=A0A314YUQ8_PRUYE|nr:hypothetical protein Pyn_19167 [Prunus yedoensis var. nudiflora]
MFGQPWSPAEARDVDSLHAYYLPTSMLSMRHSSIVADSKEWFGVGGGHSPDGDGDGDGNVDKKWGMGSDCGGGEFR